MPSAVIPLVRSLKPLSANLLAQYSVYKECAAASELTLTSSRSALLQPHAPESIHGGKKLTSSCAEACRPPQRPIAPTPAL